MKALSIIKKKYSKLNIAIKAGFWFTICNALQRGIQFIVTPIYTRVLSADQYGVYSLFMTWMNILIIFGTLNMSAGIYYNGLIKNQKKVEKYTSSLQVLSTLCTLITFAAVFLINRVKPKFFNIPSVLMLMMFIYILVQPALEFWSAQQRVKYNYISVLLVTLLMSVLSPLAGILLSIYSDLQGYGLVIGFIVVNVSVNVFFYINNLVKGKFCVSIQEWKETLSFSIPLIPHYLSQVVLAQFDRIMIDMYCGSAKAGIYALAYQIALVMTIVTTGVNSSFTPWMYQKLREKDFKSIRDVSKVLISIFVIINCMIVLIAPEILYILGTAEYGEAVWVIPPVMMSTCVTFVYCTFGTILFFFEDTKKASLATTSGAVFNVILNMLFIPRYGFLAAGYTTLACYLLILFLYYIYMKRCCKRNNIRNVFDTKSILCILILLLAVSAVALILYPFVFLRYAVIFVMFAVCFTRRHYFLSVIKKVFKGENLDTLKRSE